MAFSTTLGAIAQHVGARLIGDADKVVTGLQTLSLAGSDQVSFLANPRYRAALASTRAAAVLVSPGMAAQCPVDYLEVGDPYLAYAKVSRLFDNRRKPAAGIHASACVDPSARVDASASVGPYAVIEAGAEIGAGVEIGPHTVVGADCRIGADTRLAAHVTLYHEVRIGERVLVHSGAVIGADGFGFANESGNWVKIAQLGGVEIGSDVEIGAGTTIDRGALEDTRIGAGVILDNQIQVAHNVEIGEKTAIAGCTAIAGSTKIGSRCTIAGAAGITGHLSIADGVHITAMTLVTKSLTQAGAYSSGTGMSDHRSWKRNVVRFGQLDQLAKRLTRLEKALKVTDTD